MTYEHRYHLQLSIGFKVENLDDPERQLSRVTNYLDDLCNSKDYVRLAFFGEYFRYAFDILQNELMSMSAIADKASIHIGEFADGSKVDSLWLWEANSNELTVKIPFTIFSSEATYDERTLLKFVTWKLTDQGVIANTISQFFLVMSSEDESNECVFERVSKARFTNFYFYEDCVQLIHLSSKQVK